MPQEYIEKLHARIKKTESCWIWTGANSGNGYGRFNILDKTYQAHRVAYEYFTQKKIHEGLVIDHLCRNPICVNPEHLEPVTSKENTLRGIAPSAKASKRSTCIHGQVKWDEDFSMFIMELHNGGWMQLFDYFQNKTNRREIIGNIYENPELISN